MFSGGAVVVTGAAAAVVLVVLLAGGALAAEPPAGRIKICLEKDQPDQILLAGQTFNSFSGEAGDPDANLPIAVVTTEDAEIAAGKCKDVAAQLSDFMGGSLTTRPALGRSFIRMFGYKASATVVAPFK